MAFNPISTPVDYVVISGKRSPGIAEVRGFGSPRRWDERRGYGLSGATVIYRGNLLASGKLLLRLHTDQDWEDWRVWSAMVQRAPSLERARALDIEHPILEDLAIRSVVVEDVKQPEQTADGEWTIEISLKEYRRPEVALARPDGSDDRLPEPQTEEERAIRALAGIEQRVAAGNNTDAFSDVTDALHGL